MKHVFFLVVLLLLSMIGYCQNDIKVVTGEKPQSILGTTSGNGWMMSSTNSFLEINGQTLVYSKGFFFTKNAKRTFFSIDEQGNLKNRIELKLDSKKASYYFIDAVYMNNLVRIFFLNYEKGNKTVTFKYQDFDENSLNALGNAVEITTVENVKIEISSFVRPIVKQSNDKSKLLLEFSFDDISPQIYVFNNSMEKLFYKHIECPSGCDKAYISDREIDADGNFFLLFSVTPDSKKYKHRKIFLSKYSKQDKTALYTKELNKKTSSSTCDIKLDLEGNLIFAGFTSVDGNKGAKGYFLTKFNSNTGEIVNQVDEMFGSKFTYNGFSAAGGRKAFNNIGDISEKRLYKYSMKDVKIRENGQLTLISEESFRQSFATENSQGHSNGGRTVLSYGDIVVVNIDLKGSNNWVVKIPRNQFALADSEIGSFGRIVSKDKVYLIYNDNPKNLDRKSSDKIAKLTTKASGVATIVEIDQEGSFKQKLLLDPKQKGFLLNPHMCHQISNDKMLILLAKKYSVNWGVVVVD